MTHQEIIGELYALHIGLPKKMQAVQDEKTRAVLALRKDCAAIGHILSPEKLGTCVVCGWCNGDEMFYAAVAGAKE